MLLRIEAYAYLYHLATVGAIRRGMAFGILRMYGSDLC